MQQAPSLQLGASAPVFTIAQAQRNNASLYREHARLSPWNSKTRQGWLQLAEAAERTAAAADAGAFN